MGTQTQINKLISVSINADGVPRAANLCVIDAVSATTRDSRNDFTLIRLRSEKR